MKIVLVNENAEYKKIAIEFFQKTWANEKKEKIYEDCILHCSTEGILPKWYLLIEKNKVIGGAGLITNDFISRMDLFPWICALYVESAYRGKSYGSLLLKKIIDDAKRDSFKSVYLCTDHKGYYEKYGFKHIGQGYHPWGESSKIYEYIL